MALNNRLFLPLLLAVCLSSSTLRAQFNPAMVEKLSFDTAAILRIENFDRIVVLFGQSLGLSIEEVLQFSAEEPFSLLSIEDANEIREKIAKTKELFSIVEKVELVVHRWEPGKSPEFSAFLYLDDEVSKELAAQLTDLKTILEEVFGRPARKKSNEEAAVSLPIISVTRAQLGDSHCVMLTNSNHFSAEFSDTPDPNRGVTKSRRYRTFKAFTKSKDNPRNTKLVTAYLEPIRLRPLLDELKRDNVWEALELDELPVASVFATVDDDDVVTADAMITSTVPPSGTSAKWLAFRELAPLPTLGFKAAKTTCWGVDSEKMYRQQKEFYDAVYGKGTFGKLVKDYYGKNDPEFVKSITQRTDLRYEASVLVGNGRATVLNFERVKDRDAMIKVVTSLVEKQSSKLNKKYGALEKSTKGETIVWA